MAGETTENNDDATGNEAEFPDSPGNDSKSTDNSTSDDPIKAFETEVSSVVEKMTKDEKGNWQLPKDLQVRPEVLVAARAEKRLRDTQGAYTKSRQDLKALETANKELESLISSNVSLNLTQEQIDELEDMKLRDPDAWRAKLNEHEQAAKASLDETLADIKKKGAASSELEVRQQQMEAFTEQTGIELNDDIIENELPAKYARDLKEGKISFEDFLKKAGEYLSKDKVIKGSLDDDEAETLKKSKQPSLSDLPGGNEPTQKAQAKDDESVYKNTVF